MTSISVFLHIRRTPGETESLVGQAFFVDARSTTTFTGLYRIVGETIRRSPGLERELGGREWSLYDRLTLIPNVQEAYLGDLPSISVSSLNLSLVCPTLP